MSEHLMAYEPEDQILCSYLRERGSKVASKRLSKEKKGTYPKTGSPSDFSLWWMKYKEGKKKDKVAVFIMAYHYQEVAMHLKECQNQILQLKEETKSKEKEISSLKLKLQRKDDENTLLHKNISDSSSNVLKLKSKTGFQEKEISSLELKLLQEDDENTLLHKKISDISSNVLKLKAKTGFQEKEISSLKLNLLQEERNATLLNKRLSNNSLEVFHLKAKTESQEDNIAFLKQRLLHEEEENTLLTEGMSEMSSNVLKLESKTQSQKKNITVLKQKLQQQEAVNERLQDKIAKISSCNTTNDAFQNSQRLLVPVTGGCRKSLPSLLEELPDLQYDHSNYEFLMKIKKWLFEGKVSPWCVFKLLQKKCPGNVWLVVAGKFESDELTETAFSNHVKTGRLLEKLWKCVSEALGPGTKQFGVYYHRRQNVDETFEQYFQEKFKLYCSYGVNNVEPDRNDPLFLYNAIEKAAKSYQSLLGLCPKSYAELLTKAALINGMLTEAEWNNECFNCHLKGHTKAECRRPNGGAEVGPNECYTCGQYGHKCWQCWKNF